MPDSAPVFEAGGVWTTESGDGDEVAVEADEGGGDSGHWEWSHSVRYGYGAIVSS